MWKLTLMVLLGAFVAGCLATREPPPISVEHPYSPIPLTVAARFKAPSRDSDHHPDVQRTLDELDRETEQRFIEDLRATGLFDSVEPESMVTSDANLVAIRMPYEVDETSYCGEITVAPAILTAGLVPLRDCHRAYEIRFVNESTGESLPFRDQYSADAWFGWIPVFMNLRKDWHWYGPPDDDLRIAYLRRDLSTIRKELLDLAGSRSD